MDQRDGPDDRTTERDDPAHATDLAEHLSGIAALVLPSTSLDLDATARRIVMLTTASLNACDEAALCDTSGTALVGASSALMDEVAQVQAHLSDGPCRDVPGDEQTVYVPDLRVDRTWPRFSPEVARLGLRSALVLRLSAGGATVGRLQMFARDPHAFDAGERAQALVLSHYAALALALAQLQEADHARAENLQSALASREVIGQAQGILMERERITAEQAFELLRRASQHLNRKLRTIAQDVVDTGVVP